jgi:hypothetical protein
MRRSWHQGAASSASGGGLKLFIVIFGGIGLLMALIGGGMFVYTQTWLGRTIAVEGQVIELAGGGGGSGRRSGSYYPVVRFATQDGRKIEFRSSMGSNPPAFGVGEMVTVRYLPDQPESAGIDAFFSLWFLPLMFGGMGAIFLLVAGGMAFATRRRAL